MSRDADNEPERKEDRKPLPRSLKIATTLAVFYGNIAMGCAMNAYAPALTDFKNKFDVDTSQISVIFTITIASYMFGALTCSVLYKFLNRQFAVVVIFISLATCMFVSPHLPTMTVFFCVGGLLGFSLGSYDVAQFVWLIEMWQKESGPFVQAQHFCYALGAMLAPLIMSPFLTEEEDDDEDVTTTTNASEEDKNKRLFIPFTIIGCLCALNAVAQLLLFLFMRYRPPPPEKAIDDYKNEDEIKKQIKDKEAHFSENRGLIGWIKKQWPGWSVARLVILSALTLGFSQGMEMCTMELFPTFGQESELALSESKSADTLTALMGGYTVGRGIAIVLILKIPAQWILFTDIALVVAGNVILIGWGSTSEPMLWTAAVLFGLGFSSLLPSFCVYMERYLVFTDTIGAMMIVTGATIGSCYPLIVGSSIEENPVVLSYPIFASIGIITVASVTAYLITRKGKNRVGE